MVLQPRRLPEVPSENRGPIARGFVGPFRVVRLCGNIHSGPWFLDVASSVQSGVLALRSRSRADSQIIKTVS